jgi:hypothetical protein
LKQYWQVAAGNANRDYSPLFLRHGMAFVGGEDQIAIASKIKLGDVILLKSGTSSILAAGEVVERKGKFFGHADKGWVRDVEGWDLPAYLYVDWRSPRRPETTTGLTRNSISACIKAPQIAIAEKILELPKVAIVPEPGEPVVVSPAELLAIVAEVNGGIDSTLVGNVLDLTSQWGTNYAEAMDWDAYKTKCNLILPVLTGLGWDSSELHERLAGIGTRNLIGLLPGGSKSRGDLKLVECRPFHDGTDLHPKRASELAKQFPDVQSLGVSNGLTFKLYGRDHTGLFSTEARAYGNLSKPSDPCPFDNKILGVKAVLRWLTRRA